jgi:hypothetical protein
MQAWFPSDSFNAEFTDSNRSDRHHKPTYSTLVDLAEGDYGAWAWEVDEAERTDLGGVM